MSSMMKVMSEIDHAARGMIRFVVSNVQSEFEFDKYARGGLFR